MSTLNVTNIQTLSTATLPVIKDSAGTEYGRFCRAFVNFDGTGTIRASFNVSSVTKVTTGTYTVNFTNAFADSNYSVNAFVRSCLIISILVPDISGAWSAATASSFPIRAITSVNGALYDTDITVGFFR